MPDLTYLQAVVLGALQGITELFPVSSLGHAILVPAWLGGSWADLVTQSAAPGSTPYLAFVVALHVATALALLVFFRRDWIAVVGALVTSVRTRSVTTATQRLAWLLVVATVPVGVVGLVFEHPLRRLFANPLAAAAFLAVNGLVLLAGERLRRRTSTRAAVRPTNDPAVHDEAADVAPGRPADALGYGEAAVVGGAQTLALLAGVSRSGVTIVAGLLRGLDHEEAARFAFLLATPVILAAGVLKLPELAGPAGAGIHGQALVGALVAGVTAYLSVRFLTRWFATRTLTPFAAYCLLAGVVSVVRFA